MESSIHGWGVFATGDIEAYCLLEEAPIAKIADYSPNTVGNLLEDYRFLWPTREPYSELVVGFGFSSLYNHSDSPNAAWSHNLENRTLIFRSIRKISAGEEITVSYGDQYAYSFKNH